jgi:hypothetical protein
MCLKPLRGTSINRSVAKHLQQSRDTRRTNTDDCAGIDASRRRKHNGGDFGYRAVCREGRA